MAEYPVSYFTDDKTEADRIQMLMHIASGLGFDETNETLVSVEMMVGRLAFVAALLTEFMPTAKTPRDLRLMSEDFGDKVFRYSKAIRQESQAKGEPVIYRFGGTTVVAPGNA